MKHWTRMLGRRRRWFEHGEILELRPGDFLVVETRERVTQEQMQDIKQQLAAFTGLSDKRIIIVYNASLKVLREGEPPPPPVILAPGRA